MPDTGSEAIGTSRGRYQFDFTWDGPYGHLVRLMEQVGAREGVVLDLGCGYGAIAEPISSLGAEYVGCDIDKSALEDLRSRGFSGYEVNLAGDLSEQFEEVLRGLQGKRITAVVMQDVLEHLPFTTRTLTSLRNAFKLLGEPMLFVSVPNIAHVDVGAKLALGRFDYTATGLIDETHVSFFTESRLRSEMAAQGWQQCAANDFELAKSDQHFPPSHPGLALEAPLGSHIRHLRGQVDKSSTVNQFIRAFAVTPISVPSAEVGDSGGTRFLCVLVRTQGKRMDNLREALTCLAAQTCDDFSVKLLVHSSDEGLVKGVKEIVDEFDSHFSSRVSVIQVVGGQRARPLNVGLDLLDASYLSFLDDDDLVTGNWVQAFKEGATASGAQIVRSVTVDQQVERVTESGALAPYLIHTGLHPKHAFVFDFIQHFYSNQTPICSFAVPASVIDSFNLRFDENLPVTEDWQFLLRAVQLTGVVDTQVVTSIYRRWVGRDGSEYLVDSSVWDGIKTAILHDLDQAPLLFPPGSASRISRLQADMERARHVANEEREGRSRAEGLAQDYRQKAEHYHQEAQHYRQDAEVYRQKVDGYERSLSWKVTFPIRWFLYQARRRLLRQQLHR